MDYSIILMNQYRRELTLTIDRRQAMKNTLKNVFSSVSSSAVTTIVGMLVLVFMSFKIGQDMGVVLAKGVFFSMISILTVLPFLVLALDPLIRKTEKKVLTPGMAPLGRFSFRFRRGITVFFILFFIAVVIGKGQTGIALLTEGSASSLGIMDATPSSSAFS
jgi:multidrug efflux pump subunit AcrB